MEEKNKNLKNKINIYILYKLLRDFFDKADPFSS